MVRTVVGVVRGGNSNEYDLSLKTGAAVLSALPQERYDVQDIFIDRQGIWHRRGIPSAPVRALSQLDVVFNAVHGGMGEDGTVSRIVERAGIPLVGSAAFPSALSYDKGRARDILVRYGIRMPEGVYFTLNDRMDTGEMARIAFSRFPAPYMVKPAHDGASHGIRIARTIIELPDVIADVLDIYGAVVVEDFVRGHDVSVGVIEGFRNESLYVLPPAHMIVSDGSHFIHSQLHRDQGITYKVPSNFSHTDKQKLMTAARQAHQILGLGHFSRADFILTPRGPYLLEVNAVPGLYEGSSFPHMLESVGSSVREFAEHGIRRARGL